MHPKLPAAKPDVSQLEKERLAMFLAIFCGAAVTAVVVLFLMVVSLQLMLGVLGVSLAILVYGGLHYLMWGWCQKDDSSDAEAGRSQTPDAPWSG